MNSKIYVVEMLRWGDRENHSYVLGAFNSRELAEKYAEIEENSRGGKYDAWISERDLNIPYKMKHIKGAKHES